MHNLLDAWPFLERKNLVFKSKQFDNTLFANIYSLLVNGFTKPGPVTVQESARSLRRN